MFLKNLFDLIVGGEAAFACCLQASIDTLKFLRCRVIRTRSQACFNLQRDLCEFDLSCLRPSLDTAQCVLKNLGCYAGKYSMLFVQLKGCQVNTNLRVGPHPSATASLHGWNTSVAPLLVSPSRSTMLGQANFIGRVWMRASS